MRPLVEMGDQRELLQGRGAGGGTSWKIWTAQSMCVDAGDSRQLRSMATLKDSQAGTEMSRSKQAK